MKKLPFYAFYTTTYDMDFNKTETEHKRPVYGGCKYEFAPFLSKQ